MDKKAEIECLERAIRFGKKQHGKSREIVVYLDGTDISRDDEERPDFVKNCTVNGKSGSGAVVGIEHFCIDHLSIKKNDGKIASKGAVQRKDEKKIFDKWQNKILSTDAVPDEAINDIINLVATQLEKRKEATYGDFLQAFKYSLNNHLEKVDEYRSNLSKISSGKK